jgi:hypothetical protein
MAFRVTEALPDALLRLVTWTRIADSPGEKHANLPGPVSTPEERPIAGNRHAVSVTQIRIVIPQCLVLHAAIIPERN